MPSLAWTDLGEAWTGVGWPRRQPVDAVAGVLQQLRQKSRQVEEEVDWLEPSLSRGLDQGRRKSGLREDHRHQPSPELGLR